MCYDHEQRDVSELLERLLNESTQARELVLAIFTDEKKDFEVVRRIQQPVWIPNSVYYTDEFPSWQ